MTFKEISFDNNGKLRRLDKVENFQSNQKHEIFLNQTHIRYLYKPLINKDLNPPVLYPCSLSEPNRVPCTRFKIDVFLNSKATTRIIEIK